MVIPDTLHILEKETLIKPKAHDRQKVLNFMVANKTEIAVVGIFVLQFVNLILLWLHLLSIVFTFNKRNVNNYEHNTRSGGSDSSG